MGPRNGAEMGREEEERNGVEMGRGNDNVIVKDEEGGILHPSFEERRRKLPVNVSNGLRSRETGCGKLQRGGISGRYLWERLMGVGRNEGCESSRDVPAPRAGELQGRKGGGDRDCEQFYKGSKESANMSRDGDTLQPCEQGRKKLLKLHSGDSPGVAAVSERSEDLDKENSRRPGSVVSRSGKVRRGRINGNPHAVYERSVDLDKENSRHPGVVVSRRRGQLNGIQPGQHREGGGRGKEKVHTLDPDKIEKNYYEFLSIFQVSGKTLVYRGKDGIQYKYNESFDEGRSKMDAKGPPDPPPPIRRMTPQPSNKRLAPSEKKVPPNQSGAGLDSEFRQGAMNVLLKPYDRKEHTDLVKSAAERTPHLRTRNLRSRQPRYYDEATMGRSLLDHHGDLKKKIQQVEQDDPHKALLLLRGFVYYMQHVCMEDVFEPWKDTLWLEAMNQTT